MKNVHIEAAGETRWRACTASGYWSMRLTGGLRPGSLAGWGDTGDVGVAWQEHPRPDHQRAAVTGATQTAWFIMLPAKEFGESNRVDEEMVTRGCDLRLSANGVAVRKSLCTSEIPRVTSWPLETAKRCKPQDRITFAQFRRLRG